MSYNLKQIWFFFLSFFFSSYYHQIFNSFATRRMLYGVFPLLIRKDKQKLTSKIGLIVAERILKEKKHFENTYVYIPGWTIRKSCNNKIQTDSIFLILASPFLLSSFHTSIHPNSQRINDRTNKQTKNSQQALEHNKSNIFRSLLLIQHQIYLHTYAGRACMYKYKWCDVCACSNGIPWNKCARAQRPKANGKYVKDTGCLVKNISTDFTPSHLIIALFDG